MPSKFTRSLYRTLIIITGAFLSCVALSSAEEKADETIFKYKKELSITDAQEQNLRDILSKLQDYLAEKTTELNRHRAELNKMIADKADLSIIKTRLRTIARIQADATYEDITSIRAIEEELTAAQMIKWRGMQEDFRKKMQQAQAAATKATESTGEQKKITQ